MICNVYNCAANNGNGYCEIQSYVTIDSEGCCEDMDVIIDDDNEEE